MSIPKKELDRQVANIAAMLKNFCSEVDRAYAMPNKDQRRAGNEFDRATLDGAAGLLPAARKKIDLLERHILETR